MEGEKRRKKVLEALAAADEPLSAGALAKALGVSRQIIVGDVALLRATGVDVTATPRGYVLGRGEGGVTGTVACVHDAGQMAQELYLMVDQGCQVVDVVVEHPVYGQITGQLRLNSRYDVDCFLARAREAQPLSALTGGIHLHTLRAPDRATLERTRAALDQAGFLYR